VVARRRYWGMLVCLWPCERTHGTRYLSIRRIREFGGFGVEIWGT
jgi:hypothetical protein